MIPWYVLQYRGIAIYFSVNCVFLSYCFLLSATEYFLAHPPSGFFYQPDMNFSSHCRIVIPSFDCSSYSFHWKWALSVPFGVLFHITQCYGSLTEFYIAETLQQLFFFFSECSASFLQVHVRLYLIEVFENFALFFMGATSNT